MARCMVWGLASPFTELTCIEQFVYFTMVGARSAPFRSLLRPATVRAGWWQLTAPPSPGSQGSQKAVWPRHTKAQPPASRRHCLCGALWVSQAPWRDQPEAGLQMRPHPSLTFPTLCSLASSLPSSWEHCPDESLAQESSCSWEPHRRHRRNWAIGSWLATVLGIHSKEGAEGEFYSSGQSW